MNGKDNIEVLKNKILPIVHNNEKYSEVILNTVNSLLALEKVRDLIFKYRCSAVTMRNQKTYFTDHDLGYCEGALEVFEEVEKDIEGILKSYKVL